MAILYVLALVVCKSLAAPANSSQALMLVHSTRAANDTSLFATHTDPSSVALVTPVVSISLSNTISTPYSRIIASNSSSSTVRFPLSLIPSISPFQDSIMSRPTSTVFVTDAGTAFETTVVATPSLASMVTAATTTSSISSSMSPSPSSWDDRTFWAPPPQMTDLSTFNVTSFPVGQHNLKLVADIPSEAFSPTAHLQALSASSTVLQLVYPAHSVNPRSRPAGGADFYATPLNLGGARNVTLAYSVFFPTDFDWVKGGKLPGLFGGHTGCSGGASARDCFSTRLMWRRGGVGELYLYAPRDKQSVALCAEVDCDAAYGFSVGRGTFRFTAGNWTHLTQNVVLNTPGRNDGEFTLVVDGRPVIERIDMFYRDVARHRAEPVEFIGLFFSTFFGGHGRAYATPRMQHTWFKDFAITRHD